MIASQFSHWLQAALLHGRRINRSRNSNDNAVNSQAQCQYLAGWHISRLKVMQCVLVVLSVLSLYYVVVKHCRPAADEWVSGCSTCRRGWHSLLYAGLQCCWWRESRGDASCRHCRCRVVCSSEDSEHSLLTASPAADICDSCRASLTPSLHHRPGLEP